MHEKVWGRNVLQFYNNRKYLEHNYVTAKLSSLETFHVYSNFTVARKNKLDKTDYKESSVNITDRLFKHPLYQNLTSNNSNALAIQALIQT